MCGLVGLLSAAGISKQDFWQLVTPLRHRGPDAEDVFVNSDQTVALGHLRLSIIDLSSAANQPYHSNNGRYTIVFNGEIYNFQHLRDKLSKDYNITFRTHSDTEVIVEGFAVMGMKIVDQLEGMFAIAILDHATNTITLIRDRFGKKPLFYFQNDTHFIFASEIKSLLRHPVVQSNKRISSTAIARFLHLGYIPEPDTIYESIKKFPAGCFGVKSLGEPLKITRYYDLIGQVEQRQNKKGKDEIATLRELLREAVEKRLVSDVPVGSFLSGGVDSSIITAIAARASSAKLKTFSIGFREDKYNESKYAKRVAGLLNTEHTEHILGHAEAIGYMENYLEHFDEPFSDTSAIPTMLVSKLARADVKVALTGDGGDELFQGYGSYLWANRLQNPVVQFFRPVLKEALGAIPNNRLQRISYLFRSPGGGLRSHIFSQEQYLFSQDEIFDDLLIAPEQYSKFIYRDIESGALQHASDQQAFFDLQYYLKDDLLVKVDRASMAFGLECRCPFLDHALVEHAINMSLSNKVRNGQTKYILRTILKDFLPEELVERKKWGFSIPLNIWLQTDLSYLIDQYLSDDAVEKVGLVKLKTVQELKSRFRAGQDYLYNRIWALVVLHWWILKHQDG